MQILNSSVGNKLMKNEEFVAAVASNFEMREAVSYISQAIEGLVSATSTKHYQRQQVIMGPCKNKDWAKVR